MKKLIASLVVMFAACAYASYVPEYPQNYIGWQCVAVSQAGRAYYSAVYTNPSDAQRVAINACYQSGEYNCQVRQCVQVVK